jgi:signal peptidase II
MILTVVVIALLVGFDQVTKFLAVGLQELPGHSYEFWPDVLHFTYLENRGAAFGILQGQQWFFYVVTIISLCVIVWAFWKYRPMPGLFKSAMILVTAGCLGNFIDRLLHGYVIDFIEIRLFPFYIFNIADMCSCIGIALLAIYILFYHDKYFPGKEEVDEKAVQAVSSPPENENKTVVTAGEEEAT